MGEEDTRRQALNVARMRMLGAEVVPVTVRQPHPQGRHQRGVPRLGGQRRQHPLPARHRRRPAPVPGHGPRLPARHRRRGARDRSWSCTGRLPDAVVACVGGGSNAIGVFHAFIPDAGRAAVRLRGRRRGRGHRPARRHHRRRARRRLPRRAHLSSCRTTTGQTLPVHSISAGLDYPGVGPEHAWLPTPAAPPTRRSPTPRPWRRSRCCAAPRASSRRSSARTRWPARCSSARELGPDADRSW